MADTFITLKGGWRSGALGGVGPLPLQHPELLAACHGAGFLTVSNAQSGNTCSYRFCAGCCSGRCILVDDGLHTGGAWLWLADL